MLLPLVLVLWLAVVVQARSTGRVLVWVLASPDTFPERAQAIMDTWASKADQVLFMSALTHPGFPCVVLDFDSSSSLVLFDDTMQALKHISLQMKDHFDWIVKASDMTYVAMDNLRMYLSQFDFHDSLCIGNPMTYPNHQYRDAHDGASFILSRPALDSLVLAHQLGSLTPYNQYTSTTRYVFDQLHVIGVPFIHALGPDGLDLLLPHSIDILRQCSVSRVSCPIWFTMEAILTWKCCSSVWITSCYLSAAELRSLHQKMLDRSTASSAPVNIPTTQLSIVITSPTPPLPLLAGKVLVWVRTSPPHHGSRAAVIAATWARNCDKLIFLSTKPDSSLGIVGLPFSNEDQWKEDAWRYILQHYRDEFSWYLAVEDNYFVAPLKLKAMLSNLRSEKGQVVVSETSSDSFIPATPMALDRKALETIFSSKLRDPWLKLRSGSVLGLGLEMFRNITWDVASKSDHRITLVTSYYPLQQAKHSFTQYMQWMTYFLGQITTPVVVFAPEPVASHIRQVRGELPGFVVSNYSSPFDVPELHGLEETYEQQHLIDPEAWHHSARLYAVWNSKESFLRSITLTNPFQSTYFFWVDIGYFRVPHPYHNWPSIERIVHVLHHDPSQIVQMLVKPFPTHLQAPNPHPIYYRDFCGGGFFGGRADAVLKFVELFYKTQKQMLAQGDFIGIDQSVFNSLLVSNADRMLVVPAYLPCILIRDEWFFMRHVMADPAEATSVVREHVKGVFAVPVERVFSAAAEQQLCAAYGRPMT